MALDEYMAIESDSPVDDLLVLHQGGTSFTQAPYVRGEDTNWGVPTRVPQYASSIDTEGPLLTDVSMGPREKTFRIGCQGATKNERVANLQALERVVGSIVQFRGGWLHVRRKGLQRRVRYRIVFADVAEIWGKTASRSSIIPVQLTLVCKPWGYLQSTSLLEQWTDDSIASGDWTLDAGSASTLTITGGRLQPNGSLATERRLISEASELPDGQTEVTFTAGATLTGLEVIAVLKRIDANNYLRARYRDTGTQTQLTIESVINGTPATLATTTGARINTAGVHYLRGRIEGNRVRVTLNSRTVGAVSAPAPTQAFPWASPTFASIAATSVSLTAAARSTFGTGIRGSFGFAWIPVDAAARIRRVNVSRIYGESSTGGGVGGLPLPAVLSVPALPGDADADAAIRHGANAGLSPGWAMVASWPAQDAANALLNPGFELGVTTPWSVAAVAGITAAATSITAINTEARSGDYAARVVTPATAGSGVVHPVYGGLRHGRGFKAGEPVRVRVRMRSPSNTNQMVVGIGFDGTDLATSAPLALSTAWTEHTVTWYPTADRAVAYVFVKTNGATATTVDIDDIVLDDGIEDPDPDMLRGGAPPFGIIPAASWVSTPLVGAAVTTHASARHGFVLATSGAGSARFPILPGLARKAAQFGSTLLVEFFARLQVATASALVLTPTLENTFISLPPADGPASRSYAWPGGTYWRVVKLGTFAIPLREDEPELDNWDLKIGWNLANVSFDWIVGVDPLRRAALPMATATSGNGLAATNADARIQPDGRLERVGSFVAGGEAVLGGSPLRVPQDGGDVLVWFDVQAPEITPITNNGVIVGTAELELTPKVAIQAED